MGLKKLKIFLEMIKFEHSIFALPFAYLGLFLASRGFPDWYIFGWVTLAMVSMRTAAMSVNRLVDEKIDGENPRTKNRALPRRLLRRPLVWLIVAISIGVFIYSASRLNSLCLRLTPVPIALIWIYPYLKRWTWVSHWVLGLVLGIAPFGAWLAVRPEWSWTAALLTVAVMCWTSGFDIFYALQDETFDRSKGIFSLPAQFGSKRAIFIAKRLQGFSVLALCLTGILASLGLFYWAGMVFAAGFIYREQRLVDKFGLAKIDEAFFTMNAWVSVVIFFATFLDLTFHKMKVL